MMAHRLARLQALFPHLLWSTQRQELSLTIAAEQSLDVLTLLKEHPDAFYEQLIDMCGVDYWQRRPMRYEVVYHLLSVVHNHRLRLKIPLAEDQTLSSILPLYPSAGWFERELFDLFGIPICGNPD